MIGPAFFLIELEYLKVFRVVGKILKEWFVLRGKRQCSGKTSHSDNQSFHNYMV